MDSCVGDVQELSLCQFDWIRYVGNVGMFLGNIIIRINRLNKTDGPPHHKRYCLSNRGPGNNKLDEGRVHSSLLGSLKWTIDLLPVMLLALKPSVG